MRARFLLLAVCFFVYRGCLPAASIQEFVCPPFDVDGICVASPQMNAHITVFPSTQSPMLAGHGPIAEDATSPSDAGVVMLTRVFKDLTESESALQIASEDITSYSAIEPSERSLSGRQKPVARTPAHRARAEVSPGRCLRFNSPATMLSVQELRNLDRAIHLLDGHTVDVQGTTSRKLEAEIGEVESDMDEGARRSEQLRANTTSPCLVPRLAVTLRTITTTLAASSTRLERHVEKMPAKHALAQVVAWVTSKTTLIASSKQLGNHAGRKTHPDALAKNHHGEEFWRDADEDAVVVTRRSGTTTLSASKTWLESHTEKMQHALAKVVAWVTNKTTPTASDQRLQDDEGRTKDLGGLAKNHHGEEFWRDADEDAVVKGASLHSQTAKVVTRRTVTTMLSASKTWLESHTEKMQHAPAKDRHAAAHLETPKPRAPLPDADVDAVEEKEAREVGGEESAEVEADGAEGARGTGELANATVCVHLHFRLDRHAAAHLETPKPRAPLPGDPSMSTLGNLDMVLKSTRAEGAACGRCARETETCRAPRPKPQSDHTGELVWEQEEELVTWNEEDWVREKTMWRTVETKGNLWLHIEDADDDDDDDEETKEGEEAEGKETEGGGDGTKKAAALEEADSDFAMAAQVKGASILSQTAQVSWRSAEKTGQQALGQLVRER